MCGGEKMIVKVLTREDCVTIWNKEGDRLYYSDQKNDIDFAVNLIKEHKTNHFMATWRNKIVSIREPVRGYTW